MSFGRPINFDTWRRIYQEDELSGSVQVIDFAHHEIHEGDSYAVENYSELSINDVLDIQIVTPDAVKQQHFQYFFTCESESNIWLYEGVTISTQGTLLASINRNRRSDNTAGLVVRSITNSSLANANADTGIGSAVTLNTLKAGTGKGGLGEGAQRNEFILKRNTAYSLRFEAVAAGYVSYLLDWYEHTPHVY